MDLGTGRQGRGGGDRRLKGMGIAAETDLGLTQAQTGRGGSYQSIGAGEEHSLAHWGTADGPIRQHRLDELSNVPHEGRMAHLLGSVA